MADQDRSRLQVALLGPVDDPVDGVRHRHPRHPLGRRPPVEDRELLQQGDARKALAAPADVDADDLARPLLATLLASGLDAASRPRQLPLRHPSQNIVEAGQIAVRLVLRRRVVLPAVNEHGDDRRALPLAVGRRGDLGVGTELGPPFGEPRPLLGRDGEQQTLELALELGPEPEVAQVVELDHRQVVPPSGVGCGTVGLLRRSGHLARRPLVHELSVLEPDPTGLP